MDQYVEMAEAVDRRLAGPDRAGDNPKRAAREAQRAAFLKAKAESPAGRAYVAVNAALCRGQRRKAEALTRAARRVGAKRRRRLMGQKLVKLFRRFPFGPDPLPRAS